jgi:7-keto-8-aminopelargonate synthetase-like enzyme
MTSSIRRDSLPATLSGSLREYRVIEGDDILKRIGSFYQWQNERTREGFWPYSRMLEDAAQHSCGVVDDLGRRTVGVNLGSQDYLGLANHPAIREAAHAAIDRYGVHSAGSPAFIGNTRVSASLEKEISEFLGMERTVLFPTGFAAGFGVIKGLVRSTDHIVMDALSHACLQEGAAAATKNVFLFRHNDVLSARRWLERIRSQDTSNGILLITEGLFSMNSDAPDLNAFAALAREFRATLLVDVAHDFGSMGDDGRGQLSVQGALDKVDLVMGSFSKTFASNGGFVAARSRAVQQYLRYFAAAGTFSNGLSPIQASVALTALRIVRSEEGAERRRALKGNAVYLRERLVAAGLEVYGEPSAIVAVKMGSEALARLASREIADSGLVANLVEFPAVPKNEARFRLQVMADHSHDELAVAAEIMAAAVQRANDRLDLICNQGQRAVA